MGKKLLAGVLGGLAFFFWSFVAHDVLPLGKAGIKEIPNEQAVLSSMKANMPEDGLYLLPGLGIPENATRAQQSAAMEARMHKVETGPSGLLVYHPALNFSFGKALGVELGDQHPSSSAGCAIAGPDQPCELCRALAFYYSCRRSRCHQHQHLLLELVWLPGNYTLAYVCTVAMGFVFAGLVAAAIVKPGAASVTTAKAARA